MHLATRQEVGETKVLSPKCCVVASKLTPLKHPNLNPLPEFPKIEMRGASLGFQKAIILSLDFKQRGSAQLYRQPISEKFLGSWQGLW